jgi:predicted kinase
MLIAVGGLSGTGKSALARALAPDIGAAPGAVVLRSDVERKALAGVAETERLPASAYTAEAAAAVYARQAEKARRILAAGHSAVVDAVFAKPHERAAIEAVAREAGAPFHGAFLSADLATRLTRLQHRRGDASDADAAVARQQEDFALGAIGWAGVDASGPVTDVEARLRAAVGLPAQSPGQ